MRRSRDSRSPKPPEDERRSARVRLAPDRQSRNQQIEITVTFVYVVQHGAEASYVCSWPRSAVGQMQHRYLYDLNDMRAELR